MWPSRVCSGFEGTRTLSILSYGITSPYAADTVSPLPFRLGVPEDNWSFRPQGALCIPFWTQILGWGRAGPLHLGD